AAVIVVAQIAPGEAPRLPESRTTGTFRTTLLVAGSIRETVWSSTFATQTESEPDVIAAGRVPTATSPLTRFLSGSMTATELGATSTPVRPEFPCPSTKRIATAAAATPINDEPAYRRRRLRLSSTSTVRNALKS